MKRLMSIGIAMLCAVPALPAGAAAPTCFGKRATLVGTAGSDHLVGTSAPDVIVARGGDDSIEGLGGGDRICAGRGDDDMSGDRGADRLSGGPGDDYLFGNDGDDREFGEGGEDRFGIGKDPGRDLIDGGKGMLDLIDASIPSRDGDPEGGSESAHIDLAAGTARTEFGGSDELVLASIERVYGTSQGDTIIGDDRANVLDAGYNGGGTIDGGGGDDILRTGQDGGTHFIGGPGDDDINPVREDIVDGGEGTDRVSMCFGGGVTIDLTQGQATVDDGSSDGPITLESIEDALSCSGSDTLIGDEGPNHLDGGRHDDQIEGRGGDDTLDGRGGDDSLNGGEGTDVGSGHAGTDSCTEVEVPTGCEG